MRVVELLSVMVSLMVVVVMMVVTAATAKMSAEERATIPELLLVLHVELIEHSFLQSREIKMMGILNFKIYHLENQNT